jgi:hypothetical protein
MYDGTSKCKYSEFNLESYLLIHIRIGNEKQKQNHKYFRLCNFSIKFKNPLIEILLKLSLYKIKTLHIYNPDEIQEQRIPYFVYSTYETFSHLFVFTIGNLKK